MNENLHSRLNQLEIEECIWLILIFIIILSFIANQYEREYLIYKDMVSKEKYRQLLIIIFGIALCTYLYYFIDSYKDLQELKETDNQNKKNNTYLSFIASTLIVIAGIILLYIAKTDTELETELAFN